MRSTLPLAVSLTLITTLRAAATVIGMTVTMTTVMTMIGMTVTMTTVMTMIGTIVMMMIATTTNLSDALHKRCRAFLHTKKFVPPSCGIAQSIV